eukprot:gene13438-4309_t
MALGRTETWFWRIIGICALAVCSLNVMVLMRGQPRSSDQLLLNYLNSNGHGRIDGEGKFFKLPPPVKVQNDRKPGPQEVLNSVKKLPFLDVMSVFRFMKPSDVMLMGRLRSEKSYLVIGVPTVHRKKAFYVIDTVQGLVSGLSKNEQSEVVIVVFVADFDTAFRNRVKEEMSQRFPEEVQNGLIQIIVAPPAYYPSFNNLPLLFGDSASRVAWRSKQSLDYSFLYFHCADIGRYFLQLEDDVLTEDGYLRHIKSFINSRTAPWSTLEFGARGFIGMMYDAKNLKSLAKYTRMNFFLMPVDWLFRVYNDIWLYGNERGNIRKPPLFKHIGTFSSLDGQVRKLEDIKGGAVLVSSPRIYKDADNPAANLETSITDFVPNYPIQKAYAKGNFWGKKVSVGDYVTLTFQSPITLKRFVIVSGSPTYPSDCLESGEVFVSSAPNGVCDVYRTVLKFVGKSVVDTGNLDLGHPIKCLKLILDSVRHDDHGRPRWLVIREIDVWSK